MGMMPLPDGNRPVGKVLVGMIDGNVSDGKAEGPDGLSEEINDMNFIFCHGTY